MAFNKSFSHTYSDLNFHSHQFVNAKFDNLDYTNKNILIIKDSIHDGTANIIPDAAETYLDVTFLYLGNQITITWTDATTQVFKSGSVYRCVSETKEGATVYKWQETELGGGNNWSVVNINPKDTSVEAVDTPTTSKVGKTYRVLSDGIYTSKYDGEVPAAKIHCNLGDIIICTSAKDDNTNPVYEVIPSGDDVCVVDQVIPDALPDVGYWEFTVDNELGTDDVAVSFYTIEVKDDDDTVIDKVPFICDYKVSNWIFDPESGTETKSRITCRLSSLPTSTQEGYTVKKVRLFIHC